ncbi:uncharacterized protein LOC116413393 [Galleria mellonella]|uniref:Uncharacterized protein LOC116413393 n=1 Tax=Galleria mellonella TaxID=7137 RepID=A0ABM3N1J1_GALME|nr:uncharacterized protein LOC116413393 [Galleria mellonella]
MNAYETCSQARFLIELNMFLILIIVLDAQLRCLVKYLSDTIKIKVYKQSTLKTNRTKSIHELSTTIVKDWLTIYRHLRTSCKNINKCFGTQIMFSFMMASINSIIICYRLITIVVKKTQYRYLSGTNMSLTLCYYAVVILPIMYHGQKLANRMTLLITSLARLHNTLLINFIVAMIYYITICYRFINVLVKRVVYPNFGAMQMMALIFYYTATTFPVMFYGQKLPNELAILKISLAKLHVNLLQHYPDLSTLKHIKDFQRLVTAQPLDLKLFLPSLPVGMNLLPMIIGLVISNLVVILQLNHVV